MSYYGTLSDADTYHAERGNGGWTGSDAVKEAALTRATAYIDGRYRYETAGGAWLSMFRGVRTDGRNQDHEWPRSGATDAEGNEIPDDEVPIEAEHATYQAALLELLEPGSLSPIFVATQQVIKEKVGPIEVGYSAPTDGPMPPNRPVVPAIDDIIRPLLLDRAKFGIGVRVV